VILHYEFFQQPNNTPRLQSLLQSNHIDFIVLDEVHYAKQRIVQKESLRRKQINAFVAMAAAQNQNLHVLAMSATPVVNNLLEGKVLIELVTGLDHNDLQTASTVSNCIALYTKFITHGIRYIPQYTLQYNKVVIPIDVSHLVPEIHHSKPTYAKLEALLTQAKLPYILEQLPTRTIVYTHYREGIDIVLQNAIINAGWRVGFFNGDSKNGIDDFLTGRIDILIATSCIGTGIDGLQKVCNQLIINCLPWTNAEYTQLVGRLYRHGQVKDHVDIIIPLTYATVNNVRWSWCENRWKRIEFKKQ
jgi:SNF2 family DNA or RNA helicase